MARDMSDPYGYYPGAVDLRPLVTEVQATKKLANEKPVLRWAYVTSLVPLKVRLDGDLLPLVGEVSTISYVPSLRIDDRVLISIQMSKATIHGLAGGAISDLRGTTAERGLAASSGLMVTGQKFFDTTENREYVWTGTDWARTDKPYLLATLTAATVGGPAWTVLSSLSLWNVEQVGFGGMWWASGANIPINGVYEITGSMQLGESAIFSVNLNDATPSGVGSIASGQQTSFAGWSAPGFSRLARLAAGDVLTPAMYLNGTGPAALTAKATSFSVRFVHA